MLVFPKIEAEGRAIASNSKTDNSREVPEVRDFAWHNPEHLGVFLYFLRAQVGVTLCKFICFLLDAVGIRENLTQ